MEDFKDAWVPVILTLDLETMGTLLKKKLRGTYSGTYAVPLSALLLEWVCQSGEVTGKDSELGILSGMTRDCKPASKPFPQE